MKYLALISIGFLMAGGVFWSRFHLRTMSVQAHPPSQPYFDTDYCAEMVVENIEIWHGGTCPRMYFPPSPSFINITVDGIGVGYCTFVKPGEELEFCDEHNPTWVPGVRR